ncbi:GNAT family N-acetyltransferase [Actinomadura madurae]|uniref:GNAT family N-acetyltransferase n=1 Tax=Actinomadura madurae TaxID=1993 RepID=UPI002026B236|nr:GNAT family N-acetyltransferase [Actinomadura madurae]MCP9954311.1 N-acetyltransferase [Actinomadura madurae]MCP9971057.1 N-acetyltransferase [Actinomadura madurae]MCP9983541.1 N-acetyltransferase [Actinomadura madurae]MCQ0004892.1 N-acetyltransferase [Actinomadura madurae]MCQ0019775.1 N-acetyltransferase [Actinomadura madurae]
MSTEITDNAGKSRYEIRLDGELAGFAEYERGEDAVVFTHTEVDPAFEGKGVGGSLARGALDDVRAKGLSVVPLCPFIKKWIGRHTDYQDLVRS